VSPSPLVQARTALANLRWQVRCSLVAADLRDWWIDSAPILDVDDRQPPTTVRLAVRMREGAPLPDMLPAYRAALAAEGFSAMLVPAALTVNGAAYVAVHRAVAA